MDEELTAISIKVAYDIAEQRDRAYVTDPKFRLMFLRATLYHPRKAAARLVAFLEGKLKYFGEEALTRQIRLSDLDPDDQACLRAGILQVLPCRDRSNRPIIMDLGFAYYAWCKSPVNMVRTSIFLWLVIAEDEENQKRGALVVPIQMGPLEVGKIDPELLRELSLVDRWLPVRTSAIHLCTDNPIASFLFRTILMGASRETRLRHRVHLGTCTEIRYSLLGYGIPVDAFPLNESGVVKRTYWNRWVSKYGAREKVLSST